MRRRALEHKGLPLVAHNLDDEQMENGKHEGISR